MRTLKQRRLEKEQRKQGKKRKSMNGKWFKPVALIVAFVAVCCFCLISTTEDNETFLSEDSVLIEKDNGETTEAAEDNNGVADQPQDPAPKPEGLISGVEQFDLSTIPAYSGQAYITINNNVPFFTEAELQEAAGSYESYSNLDSLGRCGVCIASVGRDIMPTEERENIGQIKPSGWRTVKYNSIIDGNYLYNKCHLIGYQLTGENANEKNLITGTRYLNVEGMQPFENMVAAYVKATDDHVLYRVTPIFEGDNLIASGVLMEAESVEDSGAGLLFNVFCYNVQPGISIDYATGNSTEDGSIAAEEDKNMSTAEPETQSPAADTSAHSGAYAVNSNNGKIHITGKCAATGNGDGAMKAPVYFDTYEEAEAYSIEIAPSQGKRKCGNCW